MNLLRRMKIQQKLTMLLLFIGLIPMLVVSIIAYATISAQLARKTEDQLTSLAIKQGQRIDTLLQGRQEQLLKLANRYDVQLAIGTYVSGGAKDSRPIATVLRERKTELADVQAIYVTDRNDLVIASTVSGAQNQKLAAGDFTVKAGQRNSILIQDDPKDGIQKLYIATKMTVNQSEIGTLTLVFGLDDMASTLHDYTGLGASGETILARKDASGHAVALFPPRFDEQSTETRLDNLHLFENIKRTYATVRDYRERQVIVSTQPVASVDWVLATKIDKSEAFGPIVQLRNTLLFIVIGISIAIGIIAFFLTRFFTAPIIALTAKTRSIMLGDFRQRIAVKSSDEIGALAAAFNTMTDELAKSYQALEDKVAQRTKALNSNVQKLSEEKAKDEAILGSLGEGMVVTDKMGKIVLLNELAGKLVGLDSSSVVGQLFSVNLLEENYEIMPPEDRPMEVALRTGQKVVKRVKSVLPDGQKLILSITASPVLQHGNVVGSVQIIRDITRESEIDRMKTEFISLASHQLRTPLSAIRWFSEMLVKGDAGELTPQQQEFSQNIYDSTDRMVQLVNSLLNISRIESGRIRIDPKLTNVKELVQDIVNDLKGKTEERKQNIVVSVHNELPQVNIDPRLIGQVYMNLLTNAIKYSPEGSEISVFVSRKGDDLVSQVSDSGYGIPELEKPKMFQKFFRATNISKVETDGTGLGMYLVKAIIESSGGKIWFDSEEGRGTTFWFSLPMSGMKAKEGEVTIE